MSDIVPVNELDRAILALQRSQASLPDFFRRLSEGELWFLLPYHPEVEGQAIEFKNGSPLPFVMFKDGENDAVALFSSAARVAEALRKGQVPARTYSTGAMPAALLLGILGGANLTAAINLNCASGKISIPSDLMRDLADGTAFKPGPSGGKKQGRLKIIDPSDYPTNLVQVAFEAMRRHPNYRAAWVFESLDPAMPDVGRSIQFLFLMSPRDEALFHDLNLAIQSACAEQLDVGLELGFLDETDADYIRNFFKQAEPFYIATDYIRPDAT